MDYVGRFYCANWLYYTNFDLHNFKNYIVYKSLTKLISQIILDVHTVCAY